MIQKNELFPLIDKILPSLQGWCEFPKACDLAATVLALRPNIVVEIGVFGGRSFLPMALALSCIGKGKAIGIDPWDPVAASDGYSEKNAEYWANLDHEGIYQKFMKAITTLGVGAQVEIVRKKSDDVEPPAVIDLLHLDGQHTDQAIRDAERFATKVRKGGFVFTDDDDWEGGGPAVACSNLLKIGFVPLYKCGTGTAFQRA